MPHLLTALAARPDKYAQLRARAARLVGSNAVVVLVLLAVYVAVVSAIVPGFVSADGASSVFIAMLPLLIVVIGQSFVMIVAGIDLSITSVMGLASVVGASIMSTQTDLLGAGPFAVPVALLAFVAVGLAVGLLNGAAVALLGMPPFMVTLSGMIFLSGGAVLYSSFFTESVSISGLPAAFRSIGYGSVLGIPWALLLTGAVAAGAHYVLSYTRWGRFLYAVGTNEEAARISGVPVARVKLSAYAFSGFCAGIAALIYSARIETGTPVLVQNLLLDVIGAAVIGGVSLFGGRGSVLAAILGVLLLAVIDKGLQFIGLTLFAVLVIKGGVILLAAVLDALRNRYTGAMR